MTPDPNSQSEPEQTPATDPSGQNPSAPDSAVEAGQTVNVEATSVPDESKTAPKTHKAPAKKSKPATAKSTPVNAEPVKPEGPSALDQAKEVAGVMWDQAKPILQKGGTQALILGNRFTDWFLDQLVPMVTEKFVQVLPTDFKTSVKEKVEPVQTKVVPVWQKVKPFIVKNLGPLWAKLIAALRQRLPKDLSGKLSDRFLNVAIVTTLIMVWWFLSSLTSPGQAKQPQSDLKFPEVKNKPVLTSPAPKPTPAPPKVSSPPRAVPSPQAVQTPKPIPSPLPKAPPSAVSPTPAPKPLPSPAPARPLPSPAPAVSPPKVTPAPTEAAKPLSTKTPQAAPVKEPVPEAPIKTGPDLVELKAQMVQVSDRAVENGADLVQKVSVNESQDQFVVQVSDRWYKLSADDQSDLAKAMLSKSNKLDFNRLEVRDADNERVARSPYIGDEMIILKRSLPVSNKSFNVEKNS